MNEQDRQSQKPAPIQPPAQKAAPQPAKPEETNCGCPEEKPCPEPKPCPPPPQRPCPPPDPCAQAAPPDNGQSPPGTTSECDTDGGSATADTSNGHGSGQTSGGSGGAGGSGHASGGESSDGSGQPPAPITTLAQQLEALRKVAETEQKELQKYAPLQAKLTDDTARITSIEKMIDAQAAMSSTYVDFYRSIDVFKSSLECSIQTIRCQLELTEKQKQCIRKAMATVDARVKRARARSDAHNAEVARLEKRQKKLDDDLAWAKKWMAFFQTSLQPQVNGQRDDLKKLLTLADPSKDQCEVWFYLCEMELLVKSARTDDEGAACYRDKLNITTFLDCWSPKCYMAAFQYWVVTFNAADSAQKVGAIELAEAQKRATDLAAAATDAETKRRDWILKEIKAQDCCGPLSKCP
jgi:hypothetical protein